MAVQSKAGISGTRTQLPDAKPKRTRQGQGAHSKPNHGRKQLRGQGR